MDEAFKVNNCHCMARYVGVIMGTMGGDIIDINRQMAHLIWLDHGDKHMGQKIWQMTKGYDKGTFASS